MVSDLRVRKETSLAVVQLPSLIQTVFGGAP